MKIAIIASVAHRLPPTNYGPWEQIASTLAEGFVARGHDVTLFATSDSTTSAKLSATVPTGYEESAGVDAKVSEALHNAAVFERASDFDVIVNHFDFMPLTYSRLVATPMVTTIHGFSSEKIVPVYQAYNDIAHYVAISAANRHADLTYDATIHHGIEISQFSFVGTSGDYLLFFGRIHPEKGTHQAIEVAKRAGLPLVIAGIIQDEEYFREQVEPHIDGDNVRFVGAVGPAERNRLLGGARALLHLVGFAEPFGLSVVESLATGTPVIATPLGSMPELIRNGKTGFLVSDIDEAVLRVGQVETLDRKACRQDAVERFGADRMIDDYLALLSKIVATPRSTPVPVVSSAAPAAYASSTLFSHAGR
ncbi:glycosyltransferase family 4 protein [Smaragdicoccus niigatensis]|uniref:glycosyltransferase family 4 protein n=1 Tax=Smaragdicoccus niigatensis TaxID=359359 RepID=UPI000361EDA9|nr:glycosyltransferase family 4 protein [Smaragdicoccus niigatensis]